VPFLRLTRDRRGTENTFLMHADRPGDKPRLLYWYRTAPGITLGRSPLDEDAIRTIEEQHPDIDFDWPAILALNEVMTPEDETPAKPQQRDREQRRERRPRRESDPGREPSRQARAEPESAATRENAGVLQTDGHADESNDAVSAAVSMPEVEHPRTLAPEHPRTSAPSGLVDQLAGREIASRLRGRFNEMAMRIRGADESIRESLMKRAEAMDPDRWDTPEAVLQGVTNADALFEQLRQLVALHSSRE
jgi:hypothetical protein